MNKFSSEDGLKILNYNRSVIEAYHSACQPLICHLPLTHFFYVRIFTGGNYFILSQDLQLGQVYVNYINTHQDVFFQKFRSIAEKEIQKSLWPQDEREKPLSLKILSSSNICHGLNVITRRCEDRSVENLVFATDPLNHQVYDFYLNHFSILERFIYHFKEKSSSFIESPVSKNLAYSSFFHSEMKRIDQEEPLVKNSINLLLSMFIQHTKLPKYRIRRKDGEPVFLSEREAECLYYLAKCRTAKEIAQYFHISHRTVETHLDNIKNKLGTHSRAEAIYALSKELETFLEAALQKQSIIPWNIIKEMSEEQEKNVTHFT